MAEQQPVQIEVINSSEEIAKSLFNLTVDGSRDLFVSVTDVMLPFDAEGTRISVTEAGQLQPNLEVQTVPIPEEYREEAATIAGRVAVELSRSLIELTGETIAKPN